MAEVSIIGNKLERVVAVNDGWQREPTDGPTSGWRQRNEIVVVLVVVVVVLVGVIEVQRRQG